MDDSFFQQRQKFLREKYAIPQGKLQLAGQHEQPREVELSEILRREEVEKQKQVRSYFGHVALGSQERDYWLGLDVSRSR